MDLQERPLRPEDVVLLYWARRVLEAELGKQRIRLETELGVRGDFVDDLVSGHYGSVELLLQRARYLGADRSEEHTSELQSRQYLVCRLLLEKKKSMDL